MSTANDEQSEDLSRKSRHFLGEADKREDENPIVHTNKRSFENLAISQLAA